ELMRRTLDTAAVRGLLEREGATREYRGLEGQEVVGAVKRVPRPDWAVLAEVPAAEAYRQVTRLRNVTAVIVAALLVAVGLFAYFLGLLITRPLDRLTGAATKVAGGDLAVHLPVVGGGELGSVTEVFNDMVARLHESRRELERLSITDDLTGLYNRRYLMETLANEVRRSRRLDHPCALLIADVDHFKEYNDAYGHLAGDAALARIAAVLRETTRDVDCAARYGGEEFVVLMPETKAVGAMETAQRIRTLLAGEQRPDALGRLHRPDRLGLGHQHHEFLAAVACRAVHITRRFPQDGGDARQRRVAGQVAVRVVVFLEVVHVGDEQRAGVVEAARAPHFVGERLHQVSAVVQPREVIGD